MLKPINKIYILSNYSQIKIIKMNTECKFNYKVLHVSNLKITYSY